MGKRRKQDRSARTRQVVGACGWGYVPLLACSDRVLLDLVIVTAVLLEVLVA